MKPKILLLCAFLLVAAILAGCQEDMQITQKGDLIPKEDIKRFSSLDELKDAFEEAKKNQRGGFFEEAAGMVLGGMKATATAEMAVSDSSGGRDYSETNIQVKGVDEADIIKTDGDYIYTLAQGNLVIAKAHPNAKILSTTKLDNFNPRDLFIHKNRLLVFGHTTYNYQEERIGQPVEEIMPYPRRLSLTTIKLYDISNKEDIDLIKTVDLEGNCLTSRKIEENVYFVVNSYPHYENDDIIPLYREDGDFKQIAEATEIGCIEPIQAENFITVASLDMADEDQEINKEVIVGSGQNVYASLENLYLAQTSWPRYGWTGEPEQQHQEKTVISKFRLHNGEVSFQGTGEVPGHILNQFSMDEHNSHFRIATTVGEVWNQDKLSSNNVYILNSDLKLVGELEDLAPGEKIYSVRFMGDRGYIVTFKKVDPLFVIDLENPANPTVLGKLKIPGYSDYLHPYDKNHIIGIGKDTAEASEDLKTGRNLDFAWYQGVKMAIFDVSDVANPKELHKVVIGDRGTDSPALHDHKAFLFDRERNLLVLPITLAEIQGEKTYDNQHGEYTFQGAYVYDLTLRNGFDLRGKVTHYDNDEVFQKSGYYFRGDASIKRSLYIDDVLYTLSDKRLQLNNLDSLSRIKALEFEESSSNGRYEVYY